MNLYQVNGISAKEPMLTQETLDKHKQEIEWLNRMVPGMSSAKKTVADTMGPSAVRRATEKGAQPAKYSIEISPRRNVQTLMERPAYLGVAVQVANTNDDDRGDNIARSPVTVFQMQYRAHGLEPRDLDENTRASITIAIEELMSLANGLNDEDVDIGTRQGSPTAAKTPVAPTSKASGTIEVTTGNPIMAREDIGDELWRPANDRMKGIEQ